MQSGDLRHLDGLAASQCLSPVVSVLVRCIVLSHTCDESVQQYVMSSCVGLLSRVASQPILRLFGRGTVCTHSHPSFWVQWSFVYCVQSQTRLKFPTNLCVLSICEQICLFLQSIYLQFLNEILSTCKSSQRISHHNSCLRLILPCWHDAPEFSFQPVELIFRFSVTG